MKKLFLPILLLICLTANAQSRETKKMLASIEGQWELDDYGNLTYQRIVDVTGLSKDDLFDRASNYFVYKYGDANSVIQAKDKESGTITGKGQFVDVHIGQSIITTKVSTWHILRVDVKEGKARILVTLTDYDKILIGGNTPNSHVSSSINEEFPINPKGFSKTVMGKAFYNSHFAAISTLDGVEKALKEGNTNVTIENSDW